MSSQVSTYYYKLYTADLTLNDADTTTWTNKEIYSIEVILNNSSYAVDLSFLDSNVRMVVFNGSGQYTLTMVHNGGTIVYTLNDLFVFSPLPEFMTNLSSLTISTSDAVDVTIDIRAFGEDLTTNSDTLTFTPVAGSYVGAQSVTIASALTGSSIRYTIDGTTPTRINGTLYTGAISVSATETIKAVSYKSGYALSSVASAAYTIT